MKKEELLTHGGAALITIVAAPLIFKGLSTVFSLNGMKRHISFSSSEVDEDDDDYEEDEFDYDVFDD